MFMYIFVCILQLMKKAKARMLEENRSCFGRALKDHVVVDRNERRSMNSVSCVYVVVVAVRYCIGI